MKGEEKFFASVVPSTLRNIMNAFDKRQIELKKRKKELDIQFYNKVVKKMSVEELKSYVADVLKINE
jgi:hypothetical protein